MNTNNLIVVHIKPHLQMLGLKLYFPALTNCITWKTKSFLPFRKIRHEKLLDVNEQVTTSKSHYNKLIFGGNLVL